MKIKIKKLHPDAKLPVYAHQGDAGMDLFSVEDKIIKAGEREIIGTGIAMEYQEGFCTLIWDRSGLAVNNGITLLGGVVEPSYKGEYKVIMLNTSKQDYEVKKGQKIAQVLIQPVVYAEIEETSQLSESSRGKNGFGSTGLS
ncbi:MAG: dUTP diphosphatase [archaeon]